MPITISHKGWEKGSLGKVRTEASTSVGGQLIPVVTLEAQAAGHAQSLNVRIDASAGEIDTVEVDASIDDQQHGLRVETNLTVNGVGGLQRQYDVDHSGQAY